MQKPLYYLMNGILMAGLLSACSMPGAKISAPTTVSDEQLFSTQATRQSAQTAPPLTPSFIPPTQTSIPPTETRVPGPAVFLDQIRMLNTQDGWGWASQTGEMNQLLRSSDGGQTWLDVSPREPVGKYTYYGGFFLDSQTAWLTFYDQNANEGGLLHSKDGGQTWASLPANQYLQNARVEFTSLSAGTAETADMGAGQAHLTYYQTQDEGATWNVIPITAPSSEEGMPPGTIHLCNICGDGLYYDPERVIITQGDMASDPLGVVRLSVSTDLGLHWANLQVPISDKYAGGSAAPLSPIFFGQTGLLPVNIIKYNQDGTLSFSVLVMYTSQDGGQSWQASPGVLENQHSPIYDVQILSVKDAFVRCGKNLCSTKDGAQTWQTLPDNSLNFDQSAGPPDFVTQFSFVDPSNGWAITGESGATTVWQSMDGGASWAKLSPTLIQ